MMFATTTKMESPLKAELIDSMGSDLTVVNAARVSFDKQSDWVYERYFTEPDEYGRTYELTEDAKLHPADQKLISYLARHNHFTPFTHCMITLRETVPIFVARQRFKHTVGFTYNEVSRRYVDDTPEFYFPTILRKRADNKKQGSSDEPVEDNENLVKFMRDEARAQLAFYDFLLDKDVCPEQARMVLPQSMYTSYYVTGSLAAFARSYGLRSDPHSQKEIQDLASLWNRIIQPLFPVSWAALTAGSSSATTSADGATVSKTTSDEQPSPTSTTTSDETKQLELFSTPKD